MARRRTSGSVLWLDTVDSTNRYCLREVARLASGTVVVATEQTAGRGRQGRSWFSPPGVNLYATLLLKPPFLGAPALFPQLAALATWRSVQDFGVAGAWVKWPNDVYVDDRKLAGILVESVVNASLEAVAIGIGVNLNMDAAQLAGIGRPVTSVLAETGREVSRAEFLELLLSYFNSYYQEVPVQGAVRIQAEWRGASRLLGRDVVLDEQGQHLHGQVTGFDDDGSLRLRLADGTERSFRNGEVSLHLT